MQKTIEQSGGHGGVTSEDSRPVFEGDVGGDDNRASLVAFSDDLKEQFCASLVQGKYPSSSMSKIRVEFNKGPIPVVVGAQPANHFGSR
jgi:hypothetical protein